jgi:molybdate transport system substrate-binding protein
MTLRRRHFGLAVPWLAVTATAARADTTDLVLACDTTLGPAMRAAGARFTARAGVRIHVFPTAPGLLLPQLLHEVQNDILVTGEAAIERATQAGLIGPGAVRSGAWRNRLVLAARHDAPPGALDDGPIAVTDPTPASDLDGPAILARMGLRPRTVLGAVDTDGVRYLLATGAARSGLLHATDLHADLSLDIIRPVPDEAWPPIIYTAAVSRLARRPNPDIFVKFLATADAIEVLRSNGLELQQ